jgi:glycosyltransferase involved in cell wall biosynthesis
MNSGEIQKSTDRIFFDNRRGSYDFTIITPVFNGAAWIEGTIESVLKVCANFNYQYLIVDDGSTDKTPEILHKYRDLVEVLTQSNQGEANAVNAGLQAGEGEYAIVVSADDPMRSSKLLTVSKQILDSNDSIVCVYPDWSVIDANSRIIRDQIVPEFDLEILVGQANCIVGPGGVFRLKNALQIGGRRTQYRFTSDYDFWLRLSEVGRFQRIPGFLAFWREHENSTTNAQKGLAMAQEKITVTKDFLERNQFISRNIRKMAIGYSHFNAAGYSIIDRKVPGKRWLLKSLISYPRGLIRFELKVMIFVLLQPVLPQILTLRKRLRLSKYLR